MVRRSLPAGPLVVATVSYMHATNRLLAAAESTLARDAHDHIRFIRNWFDYRFMDLRQQAGNPGFYTRIIAHLESLIASKCSEAA